jgi:demethylmenaquinone methyltransferase/2-methoxy-6-polyprenyl-1,4-benzoquinol methylase
VRGVFDSVAARYDLMNDLMSAGAHRVWKSVFLDRVNPRAGERLIDVAGGTGDIASAFLKRAQGRKEAALRPQTECVVCDINHAMLKAGASRGDTESLRRVCGDAERLPFPDSAFDAYTIAFGVRNVTDRAAALSEARRVLRVGGRFACLEFSRPTTDIVEALYDAYSFNVIPRLGEAVANDRESYQYLVESIRRFPPQDAFADEIAAAGFRRVRYENLSAGVVAMHFGWRL